MHQPPRHVVRAVPVHELNDPARGWMEADAALFTEVKAQMGGTN